VFELGFSEVLLVLIIALVVIGPERLPEVARGLGSMVGKIRTFIDNVKNESSLQQEIADLRRQLDISKEVNELRNIGTELQTNLTATESEVRSSIYDRPSTDTIRQDFRNQQAQGVDSTDVKTAKEEDEIDFSKLQRPTFGREHYEELPPWYHERSDGAMASRAPSVPDRPTEAVLTPVVEPTADASAALSPSQPKV
jgi:sec-independent protein translocase protein TatB